MCKLEYLSHILRKSSTQIYTICVSLNTFHILCKFVCYFYAICVNLNTNKIICGWNYITFHFVFQENLRSWQKNLRDRRSHWSRQISTLGIWNNDSDKQGLGQSKNKTSIKVVTVSNFSSFVWNFFSVSNYLGVWMNFTPLSLRGHSGSWTHFPDLPQVIKSQIHSNVIFQILSFWRPGKCCNPRFKFTDPPASR